MSCVVLVGNGFSAENHELGEVIDSYDTVVRFNWYDTKGKEKYVGSKTDVWFTSIFDPVRAKKAEKENTIVVQHSHEFQKRYCDLYEKFKKFPSSRGGSTFPLLLYDLRNYTLVKVGRYKLIKTPELTDCIYSTYAWAAWWFTQEKLKKYCEKMYQKRFTLPKCDRVDVYGFDWWDWGKDSWASDDALSVQERYNPQADLALFTALHGDGKIKDLNPDSEFSKFYT